jgi:hypothetical protein
MSESEKPSGKVVDIPGMAVVVVPSEIAEKIGELVAQVLLSDNGEGEDDTSAYMFRGVGQIGVGSGELSEWQVTKTGETTKTSSWPIGLDDSKTSDADAIEFG